MDYIETLGQNAKNAEPQMRIASSHEKNLMLKTLADSLTENTEHIIAENAKDIDNARKNGMTDAFIDRLTLNEKRINEMAKGVLQVASLADPVGEVIGGSETDNGLTIIKKRVPLGIIGIIFESRPNVTVDAAALCFKSGNVCILRGGSDAIHSNICLTGIIRESLRKNSFPSDAVQLVEDTSRETAVKLMRLNKYVDVLIPRGGGSLIRSVVENASVPVIQTGEGVCHIYVDASADVDMAALITDNAKTQRPSVCNSVETVLVHENVAHSFWKKMNKAWKDVVTIYGDTRTTEFIQVARIATDEDYAREFNDYIISTKVVSSINEAVDHIARFGTKHSECIVTEDLQSAEFFQRMVDAAAVYVNASTRFTDGSQFGLGAEIGISNQKLHARGPMGLVELTTYKYLITGYGQIRE